MTIESKLMGWRRIDNLAREYSELVKQGYGLPTEVSSAVENRCDRQVKIAKEVVGGIVPFLYKLAIEIVHGDGSEIHIGNGRTAVLSLKGFDVDVEDLVNEGAIEVIHQLHNYDSERGFFPTFTRLKAASKMYLKGMQTVGLFKLSYPVFNRFRSLRNVGRVETIKKIMGQMEERGKKVDANLAARIYAGMNKYKVNIENIRRWESRCDSTEAFYDEVLLDSSPSAEEETYNREMLKKLGKCIANLSEKEQDVVLRHASGDTLREIGDDYGLGRERMGQIKARAHYKLARELGSKVEITEFL